MVYSAEHLIRYSARKLHKHYYQGIPLFGVLDWDDDPAREYAQSKSISPYLRMGGVFTYEPVKIWFCMDEVIYYNFVTYLMHHVETKNSWNRWTQLTQGAHLLALQSAMSKQEGRVISSKFEEGIYKMKIGQPITELLGLFDKFYELTYDPIKVINYYLYKASLISNMSDCVKYDAESGVKKASLYRRNLVLTEETTNVPAKWGWSPLVY